MPRALLSRAKEIREVISINPTNYDVGLCQLLLGKGDSLSFNNTDRYDLKDIMGQWPEFSGRDLYPVPDPRGTWFNDPCEAFQTLPKWKGAYGAARLRLLDFIIQTLEAQEVPV